MRKLFKYTLTALVLMFAFSCECPAQDATYENEYGKLVVSPATANGLITQNQFIDVTWKKPDNDLDIAFRFQDSLRRTDAWIWRNCVHNVEVVDYGNIESSNDVDTLLKLKVNGIGLFRSEFLFLKIKASLMPLYLYFYL